MPTKKESQIKTNFVIRILLLLVITIAPNWIRYIISNIIDLEKYTYITSEGKQFTDPIIILLNLLATLGIPLILAIIFNYIENRINTKKDKVWKRTLSFIAAGLILFIYWKTFNV